jgi:hypothetical protein
VDEVNVSEGKYWEDKRGQIESEKLREIKKKRRGLGEVILSIVLWGKQGPCLNNLPKSACQALFF